MRALLIELGRQQWNAQGGSAGASMAGKFSDRVDRLGLLDCVVPGMNSKFALHEVSACNDKNYGHNAAMQIVAVGAALLVPTRKRLTSLAARAGKYAGKHVSRSFVEEAMSSDRSFSEVDTCAAKGFMKTGRLVYAVRCAFAVGRGKCQCSSQNGTVTTLMKKIRSVEAHYCESLDGMVLEMNIEALLYQ